MRIIIFWGLYWGPPILGNYHLGLGSTQTWGLSRGLCNLDRGCRGIAIEDFPPQKKRRDGKALIFSDFGAARRL